MPDNETVNNTFKIPEIPKRANAPRRLSRKRLSTAPDENNVIPKRARLSLKKTTDSNDLDNVQNDGSPALNTSITNFSENRRRSIRQLEKTVIRKEEVPGPPIPTPRKNITLNGSVNNRRRSIRLLEKTVINRGKVPDTPLPVPRKHMTSNERYVIFITFFFVLN